MGLAILLTLGLQLKQSEEEAVFTKKKKKKQE